MYLIIKNTIIGLFFGTFGTMLGGIIGINIKNISKKLLSVILAFASGLMMSIVSFELIPEAINLSDIFYAILGIILGIISMLFCENYVEKKYVKKATNNLLKTGLIVSIGLALHNIPEGCG